LKTEVTTASIVAGDDIADYDPAQDADLYAYFLTEARYFTPRTASRTWMKWTRAQDEAVINRKGNDLFPS
jgi:hypothetical protein